MQNNQSQTEEQKIEDITNQDWPLLKELEGTRFSLKNKKSGKAKKTLAAIKAATEKEDRMIEDQNAEDEKLIETFLETTVNKPAAEIVNQNIVEKANQVESNVRVAPSVSQQPIAQQKQIESNQKQDEDVKKLIALGMAKIYINKTDTMLQPIRFIISNAKMLMIALFQFIVPGLITWYLVSNVEIVSSQLKNEGMHTNVIYLAIFYFACLFLWISGQVLAQGVWNMIKTTLNNLAKEGKN